MSHQSEITTILSQVTPWPQEERIALAYEILRDVRKPTRASAPRQTSQQALGIAAGSTLPPDDPTVQKWIEERRLLKHG